MDFETELQTHKGSAETLLAKLLAGLLALASNPQGFC